MFGNEKTKIMENAKLSTFLEFFLRGTDHNAIKCNNSLKKTKPTSNIRKIDCEKVGIYVRLTS